MFLRVSSLVLVLATSWATAVAAAPTEVEFKAEDGVTIWGDFYPLPDDSSKSAPFVLLFHQARSNRGEYATIAPRLNELGFHALAIDQRSGGPGWGVRNLTVTRLGLSSGYLEALPDLEAAFAWKNEQGYDGKTIVWGSSYSAALVFLLAAERDEIAGILSFSPGEYLGEGKDEVRRAAREVEQPVRILTPAKERDQARMIYDVIPGADKKLVIPERAVHGSSMLVGERNPGADEIWPVVEEFLGTLR